MIPLLLSLQATSPGNDHRLDVPTPLAVVMEPVGPALAPLGKSKGVALDVAPVLQDRKIGLHTETEPLGKTLDRLAEVLDGKWTATRGGWRLDPIPERMTELASFREMRKAAARAAAEKSYEKTVAIARKMSFPEWVAETKRLEQAARDTRDDAERTKFQRARESLGYLDLLTFTGAVVYGSLSKAERDRFWTGEVFYATSAAFPGGRSLPTGASRWRDAYDTNDSDPGDLRVFIRFDPLFHQSLTRMERDGSSTRAVPNLAPGGSWSGEEEHPFSKRQVEWNQPKPFPARWEETAKKLADPGKGRWYGGYWSVAETLARFHARTGLPVVAMTGRLPWPINNPDHDGKRYSWDPAEVEAKRGTLGAALLALRDVGNQALRESDGFLLVRPSFWYDRLEFEPPEPAMRAFEGIEKPTLDDYAVLAARLSLRQVHALGRPDQMVLRHLSFPFVEGPSMLQLWGSLAPAQRAVVRRGGSIPYESMGGVLKAQFEAAVLNGIMDGASIGESAKRSFDGPWDGSLFQGLSLWGETENVQPSIRSLPGPDDPATGTVWNEGSRSRPGIRFSLGRTRGDGFLYTMNDSGL